MTSPPNQQTSAALHPQPANCRATEHRMLTCDGGIMVWLEAPGIMRVKLPEGANVAGRHAAAAAELVRSIADGNKYPMLLDLSGAVSVSRKARSVYGHPTTVTAYALLGRGPVERVLAHYFSGATPEVPMQFFLSEPKALHWLEEFRSAD